MNTSVVYEFDTSQEVTIDTRDYICMNIEAIGAGGAGGNWHQSKNIIFPGGGGGAGQYIYLANIDVANEDEMAINIRIGAGGNEHSLNGELTTIHFDKYTVEIRGGQGSTSSIGGLSGQDNPNLADGIVFTKFAPQRGRDATISHDMNKAFGGEGGHVILTQGGCVQGTALSPNGIRGGGGYGGNMFKPAGKGGNGFVRVILHNEKNLTLPQS
jgi:hypothetical protein